MLARELLSKPDGFITATLDGEEYIIESTQRIHTCANIDDRVMYWTLNLRDMRNMGSLLKKRGTD